MENMSPERAAQIADIVFFCLFLSLGLIFLGLTVYCFIRFLKG